MFQIFGETKGRIIVTEKKTSLPYMDIRGVFFIGVGKLAWPSSSRRIRGRVELPFQKSIDNGYVHKKRSG